MSNEINIFELPVHPSANLFPMVSDNDLKEMADDIKANGLIHPVVLSTEDKKTYLIDGRNRLAACKLVNIIPGYTEYSGDINTFINSANNVRRELTKGQKAMSYAVMFTEGVGTGNKAPRCTINRETLRKARHVLAFKLELKESVLDGTVSLNSAFTESTDSEKEAIKRKALTELLKNEAEELYDLVVEERLTLEQAKAAHDENNKEDLARVKQDTDYFNAFLDGMKILGSIESLNNILDNVKKGRLHHGLGRYERDTDLLEILFKDADKKIKIIEDFVYEK